jgi:hypothetical protein
MKFELRSVRIKGCGPIDDIKIEFFDESGKTLPVCVIGGSNGSGSSEEEAEERIAEKEALLAPYLTNLDSAYQTFKGKRLLNWISRSHFRTGSDYLRRLPVRAVKQQGVHQDILKIVRERILS